MSGGIPVEVPTSVETRFQDHRRTARKSHHAQNQNDLVQFTVQPKRFGLIRMTSLLSPLRLSSTILRSYLSSMQSAQIYGKGFTEAHHDIGMVMIESDPFAERHALPGAAELRGQFPFALHGASGGAAHGQGVAASSAGHLGDAPQGSAAYNTSEAPARLAWPTRCAPRCA